jgi:hypothetical protein
MPSPHAPPAERPLPHHAAVPTTLTLNAIAFFLPAPRSGLASDTPKGKVTPPHPGPGAAANAFSRPKASSMRRKRFSISVNCTALWCSLTNRASFSASPGVTSPRPASASKEDKTRARPLSSRGAAGPGQPALPGRAAPAVRDTGAGPSRRLTGPAPPPCVSARPPRRSAAPGRPVAGAGLLAGRIAATAGGESPVLFSACISRIQGHIRNLSRSSNGGPYSCAAGPLGLPPSDLPHGPLRRRQIGQSLFNDIGWITTKSRYTLTLMPVTHVLGRRSGSSRPVS